MSLLNAKVIVIQILRHIPNSVEVFCVQFLGQWLVFFHMEDHLVGLNSI